MSGLEYFYGKHTKDVVPSLCSACSQCLIDRF